MDFLLLKSSYKKAKKEENHASREISQTGDILSDWQRRTVKTATVQSLYYWYRSTWRIRSEYVGTGWCWLSEIDRQRYRRTDKSSKASAFYGGRCSAAVTESGGSPNASVTDELRG